MAVSVVVHGTTAVIVNCYAPSDPAAKEACFTTMSELQLCHNGPFLMGGDFNCTLNDEADRTYWTITDHGSVALGLLLDHWNLVDVLGRAATKAVRKRDTVVFHKKHHMYYY